MKVLLSAFSCCPGAGSEPGIGWNWLEQALREHEVWIITTDEFRAKCEEAAPAKAHFIFLPSFERWRRLQQGLIPGLGWLYYYWWQWKAYRISHSLHASVRFDLVHHATFGSWRAPSFLHLLPVPFIFGPIGGGEKFPRSFRTVLGYKGRMVEAIRGASQFFSVWDPFVRQTITRASVVIASNPDTARFMSGKFKRNTNQIISCAGISKSEEPLYDPRIKSSEDFIVLFAGMLEPRKGCSLALQAFNNFARKNPRAKLVIIGDGPERTALEMLVQQLGVSEKTRFVGRIPRSSVLDWMNRAQLLLFPSLRDSGGFVILEAMAAGLPIICLDLGGPAYLVDETCGIKVPASDPRQVVLELANSLERLSDNDGLRRSMGAAGKVRAEKVFDWKKKGDQMLRIYETAANPSR